MDKKQRRQRRAKRARGKIALLGAHRLSVHRTPRHIYAQIIAPGEGKVIASASTLVKDVRSAVKSTGNCDAAAAVGKLLRGEKGEASVDGASDRRLGVNLAKVLDANDLRRRLPWRLFAGLPALLLSGDQRPGQGESRENQQDSRVVRAVHEGRRTGQIAG